MKPTGGGNGNPLQYSCLENPVDSMKRQNDMTGKDEHPRSEVMILSISQIDVIPTSQFLRTFHTENM